MATDGKNKGKGKRAGRTARRLIYKTSSRRDQNLIRRLVKYLCRSRAVTQIPDKLRGMEKCRVYAHVRAELKKRGLPNEPAKGPSKNSLRPKNIVATTRKRKVEAAAVLATKQAEIGPAIPVQV